MSSCSDVLMDLSSNNIDFVGIPVASPPTTIDYRALELAQALIRRGCFQISSRIFNPDEVAELTVKSMRALSTGNRVKVKSGANFGTITDDLEPLLVEWYCDNCLGAREGPFRNLTGKDTLQLQWDTYEYLHNLLHSDVALENSTKTMLTSSRQHYERIRQVLLEDPKSKVDTTGLWPDPKDIRNRFSYLRFVDNLLFIFEF